MRPSQHWIMGRWIVLSLTITLSLIVPTRAVAQKDDGPAPTRAPKMAPDELDERAQKRAEKLGTSLGLTPEQVSKLAKINSAAMRQFQTLFNTRPKDKEAARLKLLKVMEDRQASLKTLLTPEQLDKYETIQTRDIAEVQSEVIARQLQLSEKQIKLLNNYNQQAVNRVRNALTLTDKAKQMDSIRDTQKWKDRQYQAVLTPAQYQKLKQMRQYATPTNADTRLAKEDVKKNYVTTPVSPNGPYATSFNQNTTVSATPAFQYGFGAWGNSVVYPTFWLW